MTLLGEVVDIRGGGTPSKSIPEYWGGSIPWASVKDFKSTILESTEDYITELGVQNSATNVIPAGSIVIPTRMAVGKVALLAVDMAINQDLKALIVKDERVLNKRYLLRFLESQSNNILRHAKGATVKGITLDVLRGLEIPLPSLTEQKRIAAILDKADAIRRKRQQAIHLADEFLRSVFLDMFGDPVTNPKGWEEQPLYALADIHSGVTKGKKVDLNHSETLPYMRVANVQDGYLDLKDIKQIVVSKTDAKKYVLKRGDLLLTEGGDPDKLGRGYVWNDEIENCLHQNHIFSVRIKTSKANLIRPQFLSATVGSLRGKRYFLKVGKQTTGIATINKTVLSEFPALVPPVKLQDKYIEICNKVASLKNTYAQGDLDMMQSCQQTLFSNGR